MNRIASAVLVAGTLAAGPALAYTDMPGTICIIWASPQCAAVGWNVGACGQSRYRDPSFPDNGSETSISFHWGTYSQNFSHGVGNWSALTNVTQTRVGHGGSQVQSRARITAKAPANPHTSPSQYLNMVVTILNHEDGTGCNIQVRYSGQKRPVAPSSAQSTTAVDNDSPPLE